MKFVTLHLPKKTRDRIKKLKKGSGLYIYGFLEMLMDKYEKEK